MKNNENITAARRGRIVAAAALAVVALLGAGTAWAIGRVGGEKAPLGFFVIEARTTSPDVHLQFDKSVYPPSGARPTVTWFNRAGKEIVSEEPVRLIRSKNDAAPVSAQGFEFTLEAEKEREEVLDFGDLKLKKGTYRLRKTTREKGGVVHTAEATLEVKEYPPFLGKVLVARETVFVNGLISYVITDDEMPEFQISDDHFFLYERKPGEIFANMGQLTEESDPDFDDSFSVKAFWKSGYSARKLLREARKIRTTSDDDRVYHVFEMKNGKIFVAKGYRGEDGISVYWVFRTEAKDVRASQIS